jgi:hypothetical protein
VLADAPEPNVLAAADDRILSGKIRDLRAEAGRKVEGRLESSRSLAAVS